MKFNFENTYVNLLRHFYADVSFMPMNNPELVLFNHKLADDLGLESNPEKNAADKKDIAHYLSGNKIPPGASPIALVYAGHQFGNFVPQLGDGRAALLGEIITPQGDRYDIQLKGSGRTAYSRQGDGKAALGPMLREYIVSEAMHALGIKTTRSLAVVKIEEQILREDLLPRAILTRVASSHIRVGTFEYFAAKKDTVSLKILADYTISRHYPHLLNSIEPYLSFLKEVFDRQIALIVNWMAVGFIHGVMNTDNVSISGETIDYGPCAFMDEYIPDKVFSSIDRYGRYAFNNQATICLWNLMQLSKSLAFLLAPDSAEQTARMKDLENYFVEKYHIAYKHKMFQKIGVIQLPEKENINLLEQLFNIMQDEQLDYTLTFRYLTDSLKDQNSWSEQIFQSPLLLQNWISDWKQYIKKHNLSVDEISGQMAKVNPAFIPRNHKVEGAIQAASLYNDFSLANDLIKAVSQPYTENTALKDFMLPPQTHEKIYQTFCGT